MIATNLVMVQLLLGNKLGGWLYETCLPLVIRVATTTPWSPTAGQDVRSTPSLLPDEDLVGMATNDPLVHGRVQELSGRLH